MKMSPINRHRADSIIVAAACHTTASVQESPPRARIAPHAPLSAAAASAGGAWGNLPDGVGADPSSRAGVPGPLHPRRRVGRRPPRGVLGVQAAAAAAVVVAILLPEAQAAPLSPRPGRPRREAQRQPLRAHSLGSGASSHRRACPLSGCATRPRSACKHHTATLHAQHEGRASQRA
jgi:hypothetical protein